MPFINTKVSVKITEEKEKILASRLGKAIKCFPGKSEAWLMLNFEDNCKMYFQGNNTKPSAMLEISIYGSCTASACNVMTAEVTKIISEELAVPPDRIYVKYSATEHWGWNGSNF